MINETNFNFEKPTAIYFNGSYPTPLIIEWEEGDLGLIPFSYFNFGLFLEKFNLVLLSKPFTPVFAKVTQLSNGGAYVPDLNEPNKWDENFVKCNNNKDYLGQRGSFLVNWLVDNKIINTERILTLGHSQGGGEAIRVSSLNPLVTDVAMLSASPLGRIQHIATKYFLEFTSGEIDFDTYLSRQKDIYDEVISAKEKQKNKEEPGDWDENILTYGAHAFTDILMTKANVLYISGTKDMAAFYADQIMLDAILNNKFNVQIKLYEDYEHSFLKVEPSGEINYQNDKWQDVFNEILLWF